MVYSTDPDASYDHGDDDVETPPPGDQQLYVSLDRKQRKGKSVTLIEGFEGTVDDAKDLARQLKTRCGSGGSAKDGAIIIQGDHRDTVVGWLEKEGYRVKRTGG